MLWRTAFVTTMFLRSGMIQIYRLVYKTQILLSIKKYENTIVYDCYPKTMSCDPEKKI